MVHQIVLGYSLDSSKYVEVDDVISPSQRGADSNSFLVPIVSSPSRLVDLASSSFTAYCQCTDENSLIECLNCGSYFELDTFCPGC
jgi:hypothetical protein